MDEQLVYDENLEAAALFLENLQASQRPNSKAGLARALSRNGCCSVRSYSRVPPQLLVNSLPPLLTKDPLLLQEVQGLAAFCNSKYTDEDIDDLIEAAALRTACRLLHLPKGLFLQMSLRSKCAWLCSQCYAILAVEPEDLVSDLLTFGLIESAEDPLSYNASKIKKTGMSAQRQDNVWIPIRDIIGQKQLKTAHFGIKLDIGQKHATQERIRKLRAAKVSAISRDWHQAALEAVKEQNSKNTKSQCEVFAASVHYKVPREGCLKDCALKVNIEMLGEVEALKAFRVALEQVVRDDIRDKFNPECFEISNCPGFRFYGRRLQQLEEKLGCGLMPNRSKSSVIVVMRRQTVLSRDQLKHVIRLLAGGQEAVALKGIIPQNWTGKVVGRRARNLLNLVARWNQKVCITIMNVGDVPTLLAWPAPETLPRCMDRSSDIVPKTRQRVVHIEKLENTPLGISRQGEYVTAVKREGALADFNAASPENAILPGHRIFSVNGKTGVDIFGLQGELHRNSSLQIIVEQPEVMSEKSVPSKLKAAVDEAREPLEAAFADLLRSKLPKTS